MSSRRYRVDQEIEIYNFRMVPDLQISKQVDVFNGLHVFLYFLFSKGHLKKIEKGNLKRAIKEGKLTRLSKKEF